MSRCDWCNLVFNIAEKCHVTYRWLVDGRKSPGRVEYPFVTLVPKEKGSTIMGCRKDNDEGAKHLLAPGCIDVRLEERAFTWTAT
jgi:hypothetical protein